MSAFFRVTDALPREAVAQRDGHHPGVAFHASLVALFYGEGQRVVSGFHARLSSQDGVERFYLRAVEHIAARACLEQHGIEVCGFQAVQYFDKFRLLLSDAFGGDGAGAGPVQAVDGGYPGGAYFIFRLMDAIFAKRLRDERGGISDV